MCRSSKALGVAGGAQLPRAQPEAVGEGCVVWGWAWVFSRVCEMPSEGAEQRHGMLSTHPAHTSREVTVQ